MSGEAQDVRIVSLGMCRNITTLRGLDPPATEEEIVAAARQYVRKVTGVTTSSGMARPEFVAAVDAVAQATRVVIDALPPRRQPPTTAPPLRRLNSDMGRVSAESRQSFTDVSVATTASDELDVRTGVSPSS